jgi:5-methylcytosine-specific restriction protein B
MKEIQVQIDDDGVYDSAIDISVDEWKSILSEEDYSQYLETLRKFYFEPNHESSCKYLGEKHNEHPSSINRLITSFASSIQKRLNRFEVLGTDGNPSYWSIIMTGKKEGGFFVWRLRSELVEAIEQLNLFQVERSINNKFTDLIPKYIEIVNQDGEGREIYKWEAIAHFQENWDIEAPDFYTMFSNSFKKKENLIFQNSFGFLNKLASHFPEETRSLFTSLYDESIPLAARIKKHQDKSEELLEKIKIELDKQNLNHQQDERTISFLLVMKFPDKHYLYKYNVYQAYCQFLNIEQKPVGEKFFHFEELGEKVKNDIRTNTELNKLDFFNQVQKNFGFDNLNLIFQDVVYRVLIVDKEMEVKEELLSDIFDDIQNLIVEKNHPLQNHYWAQKDTSNFRQVSALPNRDNTALMHYELRLLTKIAWEFHPEGNTEFKTLMEPFVQSYTSKYKPESWLCGANGDFKPGTFNRIVHPNKLKIVTKKGKEYDEMIKTLTDQVIELYKDTNDRLINHLKKNKDLVTKLELKIENMENEPLNQILYGPPGTGKTYFTKNKALQILGIETKGLTRKTVKEEFDRYCKDGRIIFTTFHQSMSYEDFIEGIKPETSDDGQVLYSVKPGIFLEIVDSCSASGGGLFEEVYNKLIKDLSDTPEEYLELKTPRGRVFRVKSNSNQNLSLYTSQEVKYQGVLSKGKLKKEFFSGDAFKGWEGYASAVLDYLTTKYKLTKSDKVGVNELPHILIIDEINRGNISQIFGELITLIEEDKRFGKKEGLEVTLPYSKEPFSVPPNLYIIGTMNTADRSVEALDTALRRRFSFTEMPPIYNIDEENATLNYVFANTTGSKILETINGRIEKLLDRDHLIGHSYFLISKDEKPESKLIDAFYRNIIPLLQEYFYGDYAKIGAVLGKGFVHKKEEKEEVLFAEGFTEDDYSEKEIYQIIDYRPNQPNSQFVENGMNFEKAIRSLINKHLVVNSESKA